MLFKEYVKRFTKDISDNKKLTHLSFNGGKYNVSDEKHDEFYKMYYKSLTEGEELYIIEKINETSKFAFFLDIETPNGKNYIIKKNDIDIIIKETVGVCKLFFTNDNNNLTQACEYIVSKRNNKYHVNFPNLIVKNNTANILIKQILNKIDVKVDDYLLKNLIDTSVYRTGLRLLGSKKKNKVTEKENEKNDTNFEEIYKITESSFGSDVNCGKLTEEMFNKTIIRRKNNTELTEINSEFKEITNSTNNTKEKTKPKAIKIKGFDNEKIVDDISRLLSNIKENDGDSLLTNYDNLSNIGKIVATQNKSGIFCFYVTLNEKYCPFKCREHTRISSPIYIEISNNGIFIKCYDQECLHKKYPNEEHNLPEGLSLPINFDIDYPELFLSMTTKYWKSEIILSNDIKRLLEDSLSGSHYKIAKVAFNIYKDRFRIDEIKNADWFEFDGNIWKKSFIMNILISEELPRYYKAVKISDTSKSVDNLQDFLVNKDTLEDNLRNELVDSIINKLENVNFKKNILTEMYYLFKNLEPNFMSKLDQNPYLIAFNNGVYDLQNKVFRKGQPKDYITFSTGYDYFEYDKDSCEIVDINNFLSQIVPNENVRTYLLKILGRSLSGISDEHFYIFTGLSGANGKSTLINFLEHALGNYMTGVDVALLTNKRGMSSNASPDIMRIKGRRLISFAEPEYGDTLKTGCLKAFSGDDAIIARELFKSPISFRSQASMIMCCNDTPNVNSIDGGTFRRLRVVEFPSKFCDNPKKKNEYNIDPTIKTKIKNWKGHFMTLLIHNYILYMEELKEFGKISEPEEVMVATNKYKADNDKFDEFMNECISEYNGNGHDDENRDDRSFETTFETIKSIYMHFTNWWSTNYNNTRIPDQKELRKSLRIKFGDEIRSKSENKLGFNVFLKNDVSTLQNNIDLLD